MEETNQSEQHDRRRFKIVFDQKFQHVHRQQNTLIDQRDQRDHRVSNQYIFNENSNSESQGIEYNQPGVRLQPKVICIWLLLSSLTTIVIFISDNTLSSVEDFINILFGLSVAFVVYGFVGLVIQSATHYQCNITFVRNSWLIWCLYPLISILKIMWLVVRVSLIVCSFISNGWRNL